MQKKVYAIVIAAIWGLLAFSQLLLPDGTTSDTERRPLTQMPNLTLETLVDGSFMEDFGKYTLDQFPIRDRFRTLKSLFHYNVLGQKDNNDIYIAQGNAVKQEYPLDESSVDYAVARFTYLYEKYLKDSNVYFAIVPDKGYYLAEAAGQLTMDYEKMFARFREEMPWAKQIDLTQTLSAESYYRTDTHWRQETLIPVAQVICNAMGVASPSVEELTASEVSQSFYGVYYGQAALPMKPDTLHLLKSDMLAECSVYDYESGKTVGIYDMEKLSGKDMYEVYLSGPRSLLTIENPNAGTDRELILFRDSFGSSIAPLLIADYAKITLVDIRYIQIDVLDRFLEFDKQDILFLYSTLVLNNSETIK